MIRADIAQHENERKILMSYHKGTSLLVYRDESIAPIV
jgi:hypothetical protein